MIEKLGEQLIEHGLRLPCVWLCPIKIELHTKMTDLNPRSGWQHRAWGGAKRTPRNTWNENHRACGAGGSGTALRLTPASRARLGMEHCGPGACAPGFMLSCAPRTFQAKPLRP